MCVKIKFPDDSDCVTFSLLYTPHKHSDQHEEIFPEM